MPGRGIGGLGGRIGGFVGGRFVRGIDGEAEMKVALAGLDGLARGELGLVVGVVDVLFGRAQRARIIRVAIIAGFQAVEIRGRREVGAPFLEVLVPPDGASSNAAAG